MKSSLLSALIIIFALGFAPNTLASEITFNISGHITNVSGVSEITDESTFTGTIVYNSDATVLDDSETEVEYQGTLLTVLIDGSYLIQTQEPNVSVMDDIFNSGFYFDVFRVENHSGNVIYNPFSDSLISFNIQLGGAYTSLGQGPLDSFLLPVSPLDISVFNYLNSLTITNGNTISIGGTVDSIEFYIPDDDSDGVENSIDICPNTPGGIPVKPNGCVEGDYDNDDDVDGDDLALFSERFGL